MSNRQKKTAASALMLAVLLAVAGGLLSCSDPSVPTAFQTQAAEDLRALKALLPAVNAGLSMIPDTTPATRALNPNSAKLTALNGKSPAQVYAEYGGTGTNTVPVPATGFFEDYYNAGNQMYFTIGPDALGANYYRVKMYVYPRTDLNVRYSYEEYIVDNTYAPTWFWEYFDTNLAPSSYVKLETYYADGSKGTRSMVWNSSSSDLRHYLAFEVPEVTAASAAYQYPSTMPAQSMAAHTSTDALYSSNTTALVRGSTRTIESTEYYTETSATDHSGVSYITTEVKGKTKELYSTVTRYSENTSTGSKTVRSLTVLTSSKSGSPYTETNEVLIDKTGTGGALRYRSTMHGWNQAASGITAAAGDLTSLLDIERTSASPVTWSGTLKEYSGSAGTVYNVTLTAGTDGTYTMTQTASASATRALSGTVTVDLKNLDGISVTLSSGAVFSGSYEMGAFVGTYTKSGAAAVADISNAGVGVDDWYFQYE